MLPAQAGLNEQFVPRGLEFSEQSWIGGEFGQVSDKVDVRGSEIRRTYFSENLLFGHQVSTSADFTRLRSHPLGHFESFHQTPQSNCVHGLPRLGNRFLCLPVAEKLSLLNLRELLHTRTRTDTLLFNYTLVSKSLP